MAKSKINIDEKEKAGSPNSNGELFEKQLNEKEDEIESNGSASAFDETENVDEDNFDNLSEK